MVRRSRGELTAVGPVLEKMVTRLGLRGRLRQEAALFHWPVAVGPEVARYTRPMSIKGGVLQVAVRSSAWANQLAFLESDILARLNGLIGEPSVRDIRWVVGTWRDAAGATPGRRSTGVTTVTLDAAAERRIEELAAAVPDEEVREVWRRFLVGEFRRRAMRLGQGWLPCAGCGVPHQRGPRPCPVCRQSAKEARPEGTGPRRPERSR